MKVYKIFVILHFICFNGASIILLGRQKPLNQRILPGDKDIKYAGFETEIKFFPIDLKNQPEDTMEIKVKELLLGFQNNLNLYQLGRDAVDYTYTLQEGDEINQYTMNSVYEFRTLGPLGYDELVESLTNITNWLGKLYKAYKEADLSKNQHYFKCDNTYLAIPDNFNNKFELRNQFTFQSNYTKARAFIQNILSTGKNNQQKIYFQEDPKKFINRHTGLYFLTFITPDFNKGDKETEFFYRASSTKFIYDAFQTKKINLKELSIKTQFLYYFIGSFFKTMDKKYDHERIDYVNGKTNNYLKSLVPFLPKKPEHLWGFEVEDIDEIKENLRFGLNKYALPYKFKTKEEVQKDNDFTTNCQREECYFTLGMYLNFLKNLIIGFEDYECNLMVIDCFLELYADELQTYNEKGNYSNTFDEVTSLIPTSIILETEPEKANVFEFRQMSNTILTKTNGRTLKKDYYDKYLALFNDFFG